MITNELIIQANIDAAILNEGKYIGMTYEQGVRDALEWILNEEEDVKIFDDETSE